MRRRVWLPALLLIAQLASCLAAPALVLRPSLAVFTACQTVARPLPGSGATLWCTAGGQGAWDPTGWLILGALVVLVVCALCWLLPGMLLISRFADWYDSRE